MDPPNTSKTYSTSSTSAQIPSTSSSRVHQDKVKALLTAAKGGDLDKVIEKLDIEKVHIDSKGGLLRETALHKAALSGHVAVCAYLSKKGCDVNATDKYGETSLHRAAWNGHSQICSLLIDVGVNVNTTDDDGQTALHRAAIFGHSQTCSLLIDAGVNVNTTDDDGGTALHRAAFLGHSQTCSLLIDAEVNVNTTDNTGRTALHYAAACSNADICSLLLKSGCQIDVKDRFGKTPLMRACYSNQTNTVEVLLQNRANVAIVDNSGNSPLHIVVESGYGDLANKLLQHGASLELQNKNGFIPEVVAQMKGHKQLANHLAELRKQKDKEDKEEDEYFNAPTPLPPMTPGTFELILEDDDVADLVDSDIPDTDDSIQPSTSGNFSQHDFAVPRHTSLPSSNTTSSSLHTDFNFAIPTHPVPTSGQAGLPTKVKDKSDDGFTSKIEQLKRQLEAEKRKNAEKDKVITEKKQKLTEKDQKLNEKDEVIAQKKEQLSQKDDQLEAKDHIIAEKKEKLAGKGEKINKQNTTIEGKGKKIKDLTETIAEKGKELKKVYVRHKSLGKLFYETNDDLSTMIIEKTEQKQRMHPQYMSNEATSAATAEPYVDDDAVTFSLEGDFKLSDTDLFNTGKVMSKAVCYIKWPTGCGSGFVVGSLKDQGNPNTEYYFLITCSHLLNTGLSHAVNDNPHLSTAKAIFKFDLNSASKTEVKIMRAIVSDATLDYALLCLHHDDNLSRELQQEHVLGQYIRSPSPPKHKENLVLIGHPEPDTETKSVDCAVLVHSTSFVKAEGNIKFPVTGNDNVRLFYKCSSFLGASGSPCFDLKAKILYSMHQGGIAHRDQTIAASRSQKYEYEYGGLLYEILRDIQLQILTGQCTNLNLYGFKVLFPQYK